LAIGGCDGGPTRLEAGRFRAWRGVGWVWRNFQPTCGASEGRTGSKEGLSPPVRGEWGPGGFKLPMWSEQGWHVPFFFLIGASGAT